MPEVDQLEMKARVGQDPQPLASCRSGGRSGP